MIDKKQCFCCGHSFDVEAALSGKLEEHFKREYEQKTAEQAKRLNVKKNKLEQAQKAFDKKWINKLKQDQITCKADISILVTETMPSDMPRFGEKTGFGFVIIMK